MTAKTQLVFFLAHPRVSGIEVALGALLDNFDYTRVDVTVGFTTAADYEG